MKLPHLIAISSVVLISCSESRVEKKPVTFFDGRVSVEITKRIGGALPNERPEYMTFHFTDAGNYRVSFLTTNDCSVNAWWECPKDFDLSIDSGTREISQTFDATFGLVPSFTIKVERNGQIQRCDYSNISSKNNFR